MRERTVQRTWFGPIRYAEFKAAVDEFEEERYGEEVACFVSVSHTPAGETASSSTTLTMTSRRAAA